MGGHDGARLVGEEGSQSSAGIKGCLEGGVEDAFVLNGLDALREKGGEDVL